MFALFNTGVNTPYELIRRRIDCAGRLNDLHEWIETGRGVAIFTLSVRKASQASKVPPIGRLSVSAKTLSQFPRRRSSRFFVETLGMLYPGLEVARRCLNDQSGTEAGPLHVGDGA